MKKIINYSNEQIILSGPSARFNFLEWLMSQKSFEKNYINNAEKIVRCLGYGIVTPSNNKKIISFADITFGSNLIDCDFLHLSKEYRIKAQYDNCSYSDHMREIHAERSVCEYDLDLWDLSEIISRQLDAPDKKILKSFNSFYLRANNGGVIKVDVFYQPKTKKRFAENTFCVYGVQLLDVGNLSGRLFFGCGQVN